MILETAAKVNLTLEVLGRRADGYHDLATIFCAVALWDRITITPADELRVTCDHPDVPDGADNLCHRAATLLAERCGRDPAVAIEIAKQVPPGGGLGGGSANAAGVLAALNRLWSAGLGDDELRSVAAELGSDCAFFVSGGTATAGGRGERLTPLPAPAEAAVVILGPSRGVSTAAVYGALRGFRPDAGAATEAVAERLTAGALPPPEWLVNDLEAPACVVALELAAERSRLDALGLRTARLSGSGGSWFVLLPAGEAGAVAALLRAEWPGRAVWTVPPATCGWRLVSD